MINPVPCTSTDTRALAARYAGPGPRYTSYPTALQFSEGFSLAEFLQERERDRDNTDPLSLYVHIPFCRDICYYCACNKIVTRDTSVSRRYLDFLGSEIRMQSRLYGSGRPVRQMHWGGGTPSYLDDAEMTELMHELASGFQLLGEGYREYSIEIDPRTMERGRIALLKGLGFNRVSLGIQDFDPLVQKSINRVQPFTLVQPLVDSIRQHGFRSLSFDLIYGLPYQDIHTMRDTLDKVVELLPDRIACYNYAHLPERFPSQRAIDRLSLPSPEQKLDIQALIAERLQEAGYRHIGLDHYVLPGDDLAQAQEQGRLQRNFQGYSVQMASDLVGIGVSAISHIDNVYLQNERNIDNYYTRLEQSQLPVNRGCRLTDEDRLRREVIMGLICNLRLDTGATGAAFGVDFNRHFAAQLTALEPMVADGLLTLGDDEIRISEAGRPFLRNVCMVFDEYLGDPANTDQTPRYSATL